MALSILQKMREMLFPSQLQFLFSSPRAVKGVDSYSVNGYVRQEPDYRLPEPTVPYSEHLLQSPTPKFNINPAIERIVEAISLYLNCDAPDDQFESIGRECLRATVSRYVETGETIELVFPAFPFKSVSRTKVLGVLPDYAEEILLRRLEKFARSIEEHHPAGAMIRIVSDGIVYQDILGQSESIVYQYGAELRRMIAEFNCTHITYIGAMELLNPSSGVLESGLTEAEYVATLPAVRAQFLAHEVPELDVDAELKNDIGTLMTYRGYIKFMQTEMEGHPSMVAANGKKLGKAGLKKACGRIARTMLVSGAKFSDIVNLRFPLAVRISCHAHGNAGPKYAFEMFTGATRAASPWHNVIFQKLDGSYSVGHFSSFDPSAYEVVSRYGRPYYLCESSS